MDDDFILNLDNSAPKRQSKSKSTSKWKQQQLKVKNVKKEQAEIVKQRKLAVVQPAQFEMSSTNTSALGKRVYRVPEVVQDVPKENPSNVIASSSSNTKLLDSSVIPSSSSARFKSTMRQPTKKSVDFNASKPFISSLFTSNPTAPKIIQPLVPIEPQPAPRVFSETSTFSDIGILPELCSHLEKQSITLPTNIQRQAIPHLLQPKQDYIIKAQTGSGKTLAFLLPILNSLVPMNRNRADGTFCIVLTPTRELAQQIYSVLESLVLFKTVNKHWICPGLVIGGDKKKSEKARLRKGVTILVSTPGRLLDHLKTTQAFETRNLGWLVLDEADRLLELGFKETLDEILSILDESILKGVQELERVSGWFNRRVTVLCSATINSGVKELASTALLKPLVLNETSRVKPSNEHLVIPENLVQQYIIVPTKLRLISLIGVLMRVCKQHLANPDSIVRVMVFMSCCDAIEFHYTILTFLSDILTLPIHKLHGSLPQLERSKLIKMFKQESGILVCTDVAARGLDIPFITHSIQYDAPMDDADYVHRIGRTARIGRSGESLMFLMPSESDYVGVLRQRGIIIGEMDLSALLKVFIDKTMSKKDIEMNKSVTDVHMRVERFISENEKARELAKRAYSSYIKAYATHPQSHHGIFHVRKLHLGHLCKSFGMRETAGVSAKDKKEERKESAEIVMKRKANTMANEEYGTSIGVYGKRVKGTRKDTGGHL